MRLIKSLFFTPFLYWLVAGNVSCFVLGFVFPICLMVAWAYFWTLIALIFFDILVLYANKRGIIGYRSSMSKLSNGDDNIINLYVVNQYNFPVWIQIIDEIPFQFQKRDFSIRTNILSGKKKHFAYVLRPKERGEYQFGALNVLTRSLLGLCKRRYSFEEGAVLPVYPSFIQMRKYELLAISNRLTMSGIKKIRRVGNTTEFDQIKEYIPGDDVRTINWKATSRRQKLMVNKYQDERAQNVYSLIDMGRIMKMPFEQMTLLDYAINSSLVISNIAWTKHDKPGILAFNHKINSFLPAERRGSQMFRIQETLYNLKTNFLETDYERLYIYVKSKISQRSLLLVFSNFETLNGLKRQIKYLRKMAKDHLLVIIFFENTELKKYLDAPAKNTKDIYYKTIAEKFEFEKKLIQK
ncbi:MAG: DUF58 domain-containing protein, partial [Bacteroidia bacterium]|nr:DUF58 domain-containing protein [Bacteroidia bacterium]